ncbi:MAG: DUF3341 domain-containing protein [Opitutaceae bacterium]
MKARLHGLVALFPSADALVAALRRLREEGYDQLEVYTPWPVEEAHELLPPRRSPVPLVMLAAGLLGAAGAFLLQIWAATDYPVQVAGRPLFSWPAFVPVTFELTILTAAFCGLAALLIHARLPRLDHPVFNYTEFARASQDAFIVCIQSSDANYNTLKTSDLLRTLGAKSIEEVSG